MNLRWTIVIVILVAFFEVHAQTDSLGCSKKKLIPDHVKLHFAGEIGFLSPGVGYELFNKKNGELDLFVGFLPEEIGGDNIVTIAAKFHYMPWKIPVFDKQHKLEPLSIGAIVYHATGEDLNKAADRDLYPDGYYWWTIGTRFGPFFGSRITREFNEQATFESLTFYYEFGTNDLYVYSWAKNRSSIPLHKIWNLSFGIKCKF